MPSEFALFRLVAFFTCILRNWLLPEPESVRHDPENFFSEPTHSLVLQVLGDYPERQVLPA
jgi:hypothetical protein